MADQKPADWAFKVFTILMGAIVLPLAGWVWSTNIIVSNIENDLGDIQGVVSEYREKIGAADTNSKAIISIEKDIEYMKQSLSRIEALLSR